MQRDFPGTVKIKITEYTPTAYVKVPDGVMLVAANGHVIADASTVPPNSVEVRGVRQPPAPGDLLSPPDVAGIVGHLPAALAQSVAAVDVGGNGVALDLASGEQIRLGDTSNLAAKAASALAVMARPGGTHFAYIDVSTPDRPVSHA